MRYLTVILASCQLQRRWLISRLYGEVVSDKGGKPATKPGGKFVRAHVRGWNIGVEVTVFVNEDGEDEIVVRPTGGSNQPMPKDVAYSDRLANGQDLIMDFFREVHIRVPKVKIILDQDK